MGETGAKIAIITESWLRDGKDLEDDVQDLALGAGLQLESLNRRPAENGVCYGGVAVVWNKSLHVTWGESSCQIRTALK